ncbi:O-antigen ligase family protein [Jejuia pallidilutea]|uniref:O-antigen ligase family protein n=1 Tax=Jejuia pallidilutea TaxID=504487 RepID=UPI00137840D9|nr:O-antigen ligase family protein [Jejuia pallidilutea]
MAIVISGTIQAVYGNLQLLGYFPSNHSGFKLTGGFFNPGPYAGFLVSVFPIALGLYLFKEEVVNRLQFDMENKRFLHVNTFIKYAVEYIPLIGIISIILVIPATQSRASWLALTISSSLLLVLRYEILKKLFNHLSKLKKVVLVTTVILIIGVSLLGVYHFKKGSSDGRLFIWKVSTKMINDNPLFGVGFDRFKAHYMDYQANYFAINGETQEALVADNTYYAFNEFIQFVVENGVIGVFLFISVLYVIIKFSSAKENNYLSTILKTSLLSIGVFAFFSYPVQILPIKLIIVVLLAALSKLGQNKIKPFINFKIGTRIKLTLKAFVIGGVLTTTIFSFKYIYKLNTGFKNWQLALNSYQYSDYESAIQEYEAAYPELKNNGEFLMNYGKALSIYKQDKKAIQILEKAKTHLNTTIIETTLGDAYKNIKQYNEAEIAYKHAANMIPSRFYPPYLLAKLYDESGQKEKALVMAKTILEKEVKIPSTAIKEIQQEMKHVITKNKLFN